MDVSGFLRRHSLGVCLGLAGVVAAVLAFHVVAIPILPTVDGKGYALRGFALYGYLHTGQWGRFWWLLNRPTQSIFPVHYLPFLLLPQAWAGFTGYIVVQYAATFGLLAFAIFKMCKALYRAEWAPGIFLLCSFNNVAWIDFYDCFLDMQFCALGLLVIALQMEAWIQPRSRKGVLAGAALGLLFFLKPANALIFLATYVLSEIFYVGGSWRIDAVTGRLQWQRPLFARWGFQALGFVPLLLLAAKLGAAQTILQLIDQNEVREPGSPVDCTGLLRLFYFPLCLSAFYHVLLLEGLFLAVLILAKWVPGLRQTGAPGPWRIGFLIPVALSYLVLGEFFSFWMLSKPLRSMLLVLPLFWLLAGWLWEKRRVRWESILAIAVVYAAVVYGQKQCNWLGTQNELVDDTFQLTWGSWGEMPSAWHHSFSLNTVICDQVIHDLPPGGIVCVNAMETRHTLAWRLDNGPLLRGEEPPYEARNLFDYRGRYCRTALVGARVVVLITFFPVQTSRSLWLHSLGALDYAQEAWCGANPMARMVPLPTVQDEPVGYEFIFDHPLTQAEVDAVNNSAAFADLSKESFVYVRESVAGRHFSRERAEGLLWDWFRERVRGGSLSP